MRASFLRGGAAGRTAARWALTASIVWLAGCGPTTQSQLTRCQNEKKTLVTRISDEQKRVQTLTAQNEQLATRLSESEKQLARLYQQSSGRYVSAPGSSTLPPPPTGPSASMTERPNRLIPLGSPGASSNFTPSTASESSVRSVRTSRGVREDEATGGLGDQPSLAPPANGRSESGWLPKGGGSAVDGSYRPSTTPRR